MSGIKRIAPPPQRDSAFYKQLWRVVEGAVADAFVQHPDYLHGDRTLDLAMRESITKRVVGNLLGFARERAKGGSAVDIGEAALDGFPASAGGTALELGAESTWRPNGSDPQRSQERSGVLVPHPAAPDPAQEG